MIKIKYVVIDDVVHPSTPIPDNAIRVVSDGVNGEYLVYFEGDELP